MRPHLLLLLVMLAVGCGEKTPSGANVPLDQVPDPVLRVAKEKLTGVRHGSVAEIDRPVAGRGPDTTQTNFSRWLPERLPTAPRLQPSAV